MERFKGFDLGGQFIKTSSYQFNRYEQYAECTRCGKAKWVHMKDVRVSD